LNKSTPPTVLTAEGVRFAAGPRTIEVSLSAAGGGVLQVAGPSGSGKTTLLKILARLRAPEAGELRLDGQPAADSDPRRWRRDVAYLAQRPVAFPGTVEDNLRLPFDLRIADDSPYDPGRAAGLLDRVGLPPDRFLDQDALSLSAGELHRVALVRTFSASPRVLLADEPTASVDPDTSRGLIALLEEWVAAGGALVLVIHDESLWTGVERDRLELGDGSPTPEATP
jgi:putative ABC transport system ATP-binding protein